MIIPIAGRGPFRTRPPAAHAGYSTRAGPGCRAVRALALGARLASRLGLRGRGRAKPTGGGRSESAAARALRAGARSRPAR
jgi:hypothetical protein